MCGIVAVIRKDSKKSLFKEHTDVFKQMLYADALRGWDSTGIAAVRMNNTVHAVKDACPPASLFHRHEDHEWIHGNQALVGHNRFATKGKTNKENAHPFKEDNITLVHNGTLRYHRTMKDVEVDSHAITHSIAERGAKETLEMLDGAFALVWFDTKTNLLYAARNDERPLHLLETEDLFVLSSEQGLANWILSRNNQKVKRQQLLTSGLIYAFRTNKKDQRYLDTTRFQPYVYKPPVHHTPAPYIPPTKTENVVRFPNNKVSTIQPYKEEEDFEGLIVGQSIDVLAFNQKNLNYSCYGLGKQRWLAEIPDHPDLMVEFYTDSNLDYAECMVNIRIHKMYYSPGLGKKYIIGENPIIPQKKTADANGPMRSSNGIEITNKVLELCENKYCEGCAVEFSPEAGMTLQPIIVNGHVYNYRYMCPDCTDYELVLGRKHK